MPHILVQQDLLAQAAESAVTDMFKALYPPGETVRWLDGTDTREGVVLEYLEGRELRVRDERPGALVRRVTMDAVMLLLS